jgi:hypothetical protein
VAFAREALHGLTIPGPIDDLAVCAVLLSASGPVDVPRHAL